MSGETAGNGQREANVLNDRKQFEFIRRSGSWLRSQSVRVLSSAGIAAMSPQIAHAARKNERRDDNQDRKDNESMVHAVLVDCVTETRRRVLRVCGSLNQRTGLCPSLQPASGRLKEKVLPSFSLLTTQICPEWASTICFTMYRPRPVPLMRREASFLIR